MQSSIFLDAIASLESALSVGGLVGWLVLIVEQYLNGEDRRWIGNGYEMDSRWIGDG